MSETLPLYLTFLVFTTSQILPKHPFPNFFLLTNILLVLSCTGSEVPSDDPDMNQADVSGISDLQDQADLPKQCATRLFGVPAENTGLTSEQCGPSCGCPDAEKIGTIPDGSLIEHVSSFSLIEQYPALVNDPYDAALPGPEPGMICAALIEGSSYTLATYSSVEEATNAGAIVTHFGACGLCSPLQDLAVYMRYPDLTTPVRECGLKAIQDGDEASLQCIRELGFTEPCAQIWFYNTRHTRQECLGECIRLLNAPYHNEDGSLNECILCDEIKSGDVFKAIAGRTRRNTGLPSALCRPCDEVQVLEHQY